MFETITPGLALAAGSLAASGLAVFGTYYLLGRSRHDEESPDIDHAIKTAPYHRLHNVIQFR